MRVIVSGSTGFIGRALVARLERDGHEVVRLVRSGPFGPRRVLWSPDAGTIDAGALVGADAAVHLAGEPIGTRRWTLAQKAKILQSRERGTALLATTLANLDPLPKVLVSMSAIGYYGDRGEEVLTEASRSGEGFLAEVVRRWEAATAPAEAAGIRVVRTRTGIVLDPAGGLLGRLALPFKLGLGARLGSGRQWMSWISMRDLIGAFAHLLTDASTGPVNMTAPVPVTNATFTATLGSVLHRPARLVVPRAAIAAVLGPELASDLLASQRVLPTKLEGAGYTFADMDIETALRNSFSST